MRTLNIGSALDRWGTDKIDKYSQYVDVKKFDLNIKAKLPYENNTFNEIRMWQVIQFMLHPQDVLEECNRVLKPKGTLDITTQNGASYSFAIRPMGKNYVQGKRNWGFEHVHSIYNKYTLKDALELASFRIKSISYYRGGIKNGLLQSLFQRGLRAIAIKV